MRHSGSWGIAALVAVGLLAQGCATPPGAAVTQSVRVETPGCARVTCELSNGTDRWLLASTPGTVTVTTAHAPLKVSCRADEGGQGSGGAWSSVSPITGAGAVAGGVVGGAAVGAAVGAATFVFVPVLGVITVLAGVAVGATAGQAVESRQRPIQYPDMITVPMTCAVASPSHPAGAPLGLSIRGMDAAEVQSAGLRGRGAVLVTMVAAGGSAAIAGLRSGDIVVAVDGRDVSDAAELEERLVMLAPGDSSSLQVHREGQLLALALTRRAATP